MLVRDEKKPLIKYGKDEVRPMAGDAAQHVTRLLRRKGEGDQGAADELLPLIYDELREKAHRFMERQPDGHTLQPTALVHEAYLRLVDREDAGWESRAHFMCVAAKAMRSILVDHARRKGAEKRGGKRQRLILDDALAHYEDRGLDLVELDEALNQLAALDEQLLRIVELLFFGGFNIEEAARVLGTSTRTVERGLKTARTWLYLHLNSGGLDES
jgi:RNA polymerase sigma factor (TIGR02999 family)